MKSDILNQYTKVVVDNTTEALYYHLYDDECNYLINNTSDHNFSEFLALSLLMLNLTIFNDINNEVKQYFTAEKKASMGKKKANKPKIHIPTVVNKPIEVDRSSKDFVNKKDIDVMTKEELARLGTMLGLSGLSKLNKDQLKAKCMTRRSNQHFQSYVESILLSNFKQ
jgi:hypothetical protein